MDTTSYDYDYLRRVISVHGVEPVNATLLTYPPLEDVLKPLWELNRKDGPNAARALYEKLPKTLNLPDIPRPTRQLYSLAELRALPPVQWLVQDIIPEQGYTVLYGPPASTKSFAALHYSLKVAQTGYVVYVAGEGTSGYGQRTRAWMKYHNVSEDKINFVLDVNALNLLNRFDVDAFIADIQPYKPRMVVLDTLARCMVGGDENQASSIGIVNDSIKHMVNQLKCAVLLIHHSGKAGSSERGSTALRGAADSMVQVSASDGYTVLIQDKLKDAARRDPIKLALVEVEDTESCVLVPLDKAPKEFLQRMPPAQAAILRAMSGELFAAGIRFAQLKELLTQYTPSVIYYAINALLRRRYIQQTGKFDPFVLTKEGLLYINQNKLKTEDYG